MAGTEVIDCSFYHNRMSARDASVAPITNYSPMWYMGNNASNNTRTYTVGGNKRLLVHSISYAIRDESGTGGIVEAGTLDSVGNVVYLFFRITCPADGQYFRTHTFSVPLELTEGMQFEWQSNTAALYVYFSFYGYLVDEP